MASHNMDDLPNRKEKFKAAFTTILAECDKGIRSLQDDTKAVSKFTISKVQMWDRFLVRGRYVCFQHRI